MTLSKLIQLTRTYHPSQCHTSDIVHRYNFFGSQSPLQINIWGQMSRPYWHTFDTYILCNPPPHLAYSDTLKFLLVSSASPYWHLWVPPLHHTFSGISTLPGSLHLTILVPHCYLYSSRFPPYHHTGTSVPVLFVDPFILQYRHL